MHAGRCVAPIPAPGGERHAMAEPRHRGRQRPYVHRCSLVPEHGDPPVGAYVEDLHRLGRGATRPAGSPRSVPRSCSAQRLHRARPGALLADEPRRAAGETGTLGRVAEQLRERVRQQARVARLDEAAVDPVDEHLGDAGHGGGEDRDAGRHRLQDHVRYAVAVAVCHHQGRQREDLGRGELGGELGLRHRAGQVDRVRDALLRRKGEQLLAQLAAADDPQLELDAPAAQLAACPHEHVESLLGHQPADADDPPWPGIALDREAIEVDAVTAEQHFGGVQPGPPEQVFAAGFGAGRHELGAAAAHRQVLRQRRVDVLGVTSGAVALAADLLRDERDRRGRVQEVGVQVGRPSLPEQLDEHHRVQACSVPPRRCAASAPTPPLWPPPTGGGGSCAAPPAPTPRCSPPGGRRPPARRASASGWDRPSSGSMIAYRSTGTPCLRSSRNSLRMNVSESRGKRLTRIATLRGPASPTGVIRGPPIRGPARSRSRPAPAAGELAGHHPVDGPVAVRVLRRDHPEPSPFEVRHRWRIDADRTLEHLDHPAVGDDEDASPTVCGRDPRERREHPAEHIRGRLAVHRLPWALTVPLGPSPLDLLLGEPRPGSLVLLAQPRHRLGVS